MEILSNIDNALRTDMPFYNTAFTVKGNYQFNTPDPNFDIQSKQAKELFKQYGINEPDYSVYDAKNYNYLEQQLREHSNYKKAEEELNKSGTFGQLAYHIGAGVLNPFNYMLGGVAFKASSKVLSTLVNSESKALSVLGNTLVGSASATMDIAAQEYVTERQNQAFNPDKFKSIVEAGALFGGGVGSLVGMLRRAEPKQSLDILSNTTKAVDNANNEFISPMSKFFTEIHGRLINSKSSAIRDEALKLEHSTIPIGNKKTGQETVQSWNTAKDIKNKAEGIHTSFLEELDKAHKESGLPLNDFLHKLYKDKMEFDYNIEKQVAVKYLEMPESERIKLYREATGRTDEINPLTILDFEDVVTNHILKQVEKDIQVPKHLEGITNFFKRYGEMATHMGTRGIAGKTSTFYSYRMWNSDKIAKIGEEEAINRISKAMEAHPLNQHELRQGTLTKDDLKNMAKSMVTKILDNNIRKMFTESDYLRRAGGGDMTKQRKVRVDITKVGDLLVQDADLVTERYAQKMSGRLALNSIGIDADPKTGSIAQSIQNRLDTLREHAKQEGLKPEEIAKDIDKLKVAYDVLMNTRHIVNNPYSFGHRASAALRGTATAVYGGGFVKSAVGELGSVMLNSTFRSIIDNFVPAHKMAISLMRKGNHKLASEFVKMGIGKQILEGNRAFRLGVEEISNTKTWWDRALIKTRHFSFKWSGFNAVTATTDFLAAGSFLEDIARASKTGKITKTFASQLRRYGLTDEDVRNFTKKTKIEYYTNGAIKNLNMDSWKDQDYAWRITRAMTRMVDDTVLRADGLKLPSFLTDVNSDFLMVATQYQHFPMEAYNRLLIRGLTEDAAKLTAGGIASTAIILSYLELEDEAKYQLGLEDKRTDPSKLANYAFQKSSFSSIMPDAYNLMKNVSGMSDHYTPSPSGKALGASAHIVDTAYRLYQKMVHNKPLNEKDRDNLFRITPFSRFPIYDELARSLIKNTN